MQGTQVRTIQKPSFKVSVEEPVFIDGSWYLFKGEADSSKTDYNFLEMTAQAVRDWCDKNKVKKEEIIKKLNDEILAEARRRG